MTKRIAIVNYKGGTGKTTTCVSVAHGLSRSGKRVLIVDVDPQGNASDSFGKKPAKTLYHLLVNDTPAHECVGEVRENLDIIGANKTLVVAEQNIFGEMGREQTLARRLKKIMNGVYDYIFFDCAPSWRLLNQNALMASQMVILPINMELFALTGAKEVIGELHKVEELLKHRLNIAMVVPTFFDVRNNKSKNILMQLYEYFGREKVAEPIRVNVSISEAPYYQKTIFEYAPKSHGAEDYQKLTNRVLEL